MIIIFEGPDNCGKGTQMRLIQPLLTDRPLHTMHYMALKGIDKKNIIEYSSNMYRQMFDILLHNYDKSNFILDRSHISEVVYSPIYRKYDGSYVYDIEKEFTNHPMWDDIVLITFIDKAENLISRDDGLSPSLALEDKNRELDAFIMASKKSSIKHKYIIDINNKGQYKVFDEIKNLLKR